MKTSLAWFGRRWRVGAAGAVALGVLAAGGARAAGGPQGGAAAPAAAAAAPAGTVAVAVAAGAGGAGGAGATGAAADAAAAKRQAALRRKVLKDDDFVENDEVNRDPFHSYLRLFVDRSAATKGRKIPAVFDKVGLEELALIAIVSGDETPRAMFRDATGLGKTVQRGDYLSRTAARVTKILSDRVIVEITETGGTGEPRVVERAILVNPDEVP